MSKATKKLPDRFGEGPQPDMDGLLDVLALQKRIREMEAHTCPPMSEEMVRKVRDEIARLKQLRVNWVAETLGHTYKVSALEWLLREAGMEGKS